MRKARLRGVTRGKVVRTTVADAKAQCPLNRVSRQFKAQLPNQLSLLEPLGYIPPAEAEANYYERLSSQATPA